MKKLKNLFTALVILITYVGCSPVKRDGVHVGNGMTDYLSPYGYAISYDSNLSINASNDRNVVIDNHETSKTEVSRLQMSIVDKKADDFEEMRAIAQSENKERLNVVEFKDRRALEKKTTTQNGVNLVRYLMLPRGLVLKFTLNAYHPDQGVLRLTSALDNLRFDKEAPKVLAFEWVNSPIKAGRVEKIKLHITDDVSGPVRIKIKLNAVTRTQEEDYRQSPMNYNVPLNPTTEKDWYTAEVPISRWAVETDYIPKFSAEDRAGRSVEVGWRENTVYDKNTAFLGKVSLENSGMEDSSGPEITSITMPEIIVPGELTKIRFTATDDISGIRLENQSWDLDDDRNFGMPASVSYGFTFEYGAKVQKLDEANTYEMSFIPSVYTAPGKAELRGVTIRDNAGNFTYVGCLLGSPCYVARIQTVKNLPEGFIARTTLVQNVGEKGIKPKVISLRVEPNVLDAGDRTVVVVKLDRPFQDETVKARAVFKLLNDGKLSPEDEGETYDLNLKNVKGDYELRFTLQTNSFKSRGRFGLESVMFEGALFYSGATFKYETKPEFDMPTLRIR